MFTGCFSSKNIDIHNDTNIFWGELTDISAEIHDLQTAHTHCAEQRREVQFIA